MRCFNLSDKVDNLTGDVDNLTKNVATLTTEINDICVPKRAEEVLNGGVYLVRKGSEGDVVFSVTDADGKIRHIKYTSKYKEKYGSIEEFINDVGKFEKKYRSGFLHTYPLKYPVQNENLQKYSKIDYELDVYDIDKYTAIYLLQRAYVVYPSNGKKIVCVRKDDGTFAHIKMDDNVDEEKIEEQLDAYFGPETTGFWNRIDPSKTEYEAPRVTIDNNSSENTYANASESNDFSLSNSLI